MEPYITFNQRTGKIDYHADPIHYLLGIGWAGNHEGKNNPEWQNRHGVGPLPRGWYSIGEPENNPHTGPFSLRLTPDPGNAMFGRDGFLIHGAAVDPAKAGQESKGCIVAPRVFREKIHTMGIKRLQVI